MHCGTSTLSIEEQSALLRKWTGFFASTASEPKLMHSSHDLLRRASAQRNLATVGGAVHGTRRSKLAHETETTATNKADEPEGNVAPLERESDPTFP